MEKGAALKIFEALSCGSRLDVFKLLVQAEPQGMVAGELSGALDIAPSNLSFHLKTLVHAGLIDVEQEGRYQRYRAQRAQVNQLVAYLMENCCGNRPELCVDP